MKSEEGSCSDGQGSAFNIQDDYSLAVPPESPTNLDEMAPLLENNLPSLVTTLLQNLPGLVNSCRESSLGSSARFKQIRRIAHDSPTIALDQRRRTGFCVFALDSLRCR